jgi:hypothetical protein
MGLFQNPNRGVAVVFRAHYGYTLLLLPMSNENKEKQNKNYK